MHLNYNHNLNSNSFFASEESTQQPQPGEINLLSLECAIPPFIKARAQSQRINQHPRRMVNICTFSFCLPRVLHCGVLSPTYYILSTSYSKAHRSWEKQREKDWKGRGYGGLPHNSIFLDMTGSCHIRPHSAYDCMHKTCTKSSQTKLQYDLQGGSQSLTPAERRVSSLWKEGPLSPKV